MSYIYFNPNPSELSVGDCVIRAISKITAQSWEKTYIELMLQGYMMSDLPSANRVWNEYLLRLGFTRKFIPDTCPNCYTVRQFCQDFPVGEYILATGAHVIAVINGNYYDSWDSGNEIPMYYYER